MEVCQSASRCNSSTKICYATSQRQLHPDPEVAFTAACNHKAHYARPLHYLGDTMTRRSICLRIVLDDSFAFCRPTFRLGMLWCKRVQKSEDNTFSSLNASVFGYKEWYIWLIHDIGLEHKTNVRCRRGNLVYLFTIWMVSIFQLWWLSFWRSAQNLECKDG